MQTEKSLIMSALGGQGVLGAIAPDFDQLIRTGLPVKAGMYVKLELRLTNKQFAETLGISERTLARKNPEGRLSALESDRLYRAASVFAFACEVLEDKAAAAHWLQRPQRGLGDRVPVELLQTEAGAREVEDLLGRIEHGVLS